MGHVRFDVVEPVKKMEEWLRRGQYSYDKAILFIGDRNLQISEEGVTRGGGAVEQNNRAWREVHGHRCGGLRELSVVGSGLVVVDLRGNRELEVLNLSGNYIESLILGDNLALRELDCEDNEILVLDLSRLNRLETLNVSRNRLVELSLEGNGGLKEVDCSFSFLQRLDVSRAAGLTELDCSENRIGELNLENCGELVSLNASGNQLVQVSIAESPKLTNVNLNGNSLGNSAKLGVFSDLVRFDLREGILAVEVVGSGGAGSHDLVTLYERGWALNLGPLYVPVVS